MVPPPDRGDPFWHAARGRPPASHPAMHYRPPRHLRLIKATLAGVVLLALLVVAWVGTWFALATGLRADIEAWAEARRAEGYTVSYRKLELSGFPFMLRATLDGPELATPADRGPWRWQSERAVAESRPWAWNRIDVRAPGPLTLTLPLAGQPVTYQGEARVLRAELEFTDGLPWDVDLRLEDLALAAQTAGRDLAAAYLDLEVRRIFGAAGDDETSFVLRLAADELDLPFPARALPLGRRVETLDLAADLKGPFPEAPRYEPLQRWRDAGGIIDVTTLSATYGPLDLTGTGTLALDAGMQPAGAFTARVQGFFEAIDALRQKRLIRSRAAVTAKLVLSALAKRSEDGGPPTLSLPLTLQDRRLHAGPVELVTLDPVTWPGTPDAPAGPDGGGG